MYVCVYVCLSLLLHTRTCAVLLHTRMCAVCVRGLVGSWVAGVQHVLVKEMWLCACAHATQDTHIHTHPHLPHEHTHTNTQTHTQTHPHTHTQKQTQTHTDTHIRTNIYTHDTHQEHLCNTDKCQANNRCWFLIIQSIPRCLPRTACKFSSFRPFVLFLAPPFFLCLSSMPACTPAI